MTFPFPLNDGKKLSGQAGAQMVVWANSRHSEAIRI